MKAGGRGGDCGCGGGGGCSGGGGRDGGDEGGSGGCSGGGCGDEDVAVVMAVFVLVVVVGMVVEMGSGVFVVVLGTMWGLVGFGVIKVVV